MDRQVLCIKIAPLDDKIAPPQNSSPGWQNSSPKKKIYSWKWQNSSPDQDYNCWLCKIAPPNRFLQKMLPIFPLAKNVLSICRQNSPSIESNNNHYTKNILAILARKCAEIRWLQKIAVIWLQIFEGSYFAKTSPRFQNSGELFCHFQDLIFFQGSYFAIQGSYFAAQNLTVQTVGCEWRILCH